MTWEIRQGDCLDLLRAMPDGIVQTVVTSPPYWNLRDYGTATWDGGDAECDHLGPPKASDKSGLKNDGRPNPGRKDYELDAVVPFRGVCGKCGATRIDSQLGLEPTPDEYVQNLVNVFREVRRVLRDDGTVWLNLGSSYFNGESYPLREVDAAWLAALIDGEGCIQIHRQVKPPETNSVDSFQLDLSVGMMTPELVQRAYELTGLGSCHQQNRGVWDWSVRGQQTGRLLRALYPHLLGKKKQAALAIMLCDDLAEKRFGRGNPATPQAMEWRQRLKQAVSDLNQRKATDFPIREPVPLALGLKPKDDTGIPHRVAFALRDDGWFLRSDICWAKPNPMPESVTDRPTRSHEYIFLLTKSARYFYDADAVREEVSSSLIVRHGDASEEKPTAHGVAALNRHRGVLNVNGAGRDLAAGRNKRSVWAVTTQPYVEAHFATFPPKLIEPCILAGSAQGDMVLDPFAGSGTTGLMALRHSRSFIGLELNPDYCEMARNRIRDDAPLLNSHLEKVA